MIDTLRQRRHSPMTAKGIAMPRMTVTAAIAAILLRGPALGDDASTDQMRARLLGTPVWVYEWGQSKDHPDPHGAPGNVETGQVSFVEKDGKLIGKIDAGFKCDKAVTLHADGFDLEPCPGSNDLQYVRSGNEFKATFGSMIYTIRPAL